MGQGGRARAAGSGGVGGWSTSARAACVPGWEASSQGRKFIYSVNVILPIQVQALCWALGAPSSCDIVGGRRDYRPIAAVQIW